MTAIDKSDKFHDECGVMAVHGHPEASKLAYLGLYALQHRGQESAGIASSDFARLHNIKANKGFTYIADDLPESFDGLRSSGTRPLQVARASVSLPDVGAFIDVTVQNDPRPFNLGRTLVDARTAEA